MIIDGTPARELSSKMLTAGLISFAPQAARKPPLPQTSRKAALAAKRAQKAAWRAASAISEAKRLAWRKVKGKSAREIEKIIHANRRARELQKLKTQLEAAWREFELTRKPDG